MTKLFINQMIHNMRLANFVTKTSPWMVEGIRTRQMNTRYVGVRLQNDWLAIINEQNNILTKFIFDINTSYIELYIANIPPFLKFYVKSFDESVKWETLFGEVKRLLRKDKTSYMNHTDSVGNIYALIQPHLKSLDSK